MNVQGVSASGPATREDTPRAGMPDAAALFDHILTSARSDAEPPRTRAQASGRRVTTVRGHESPRETAQEADGSDPRTGRHQTVARHAAAARREPTASPTADPTPSRSGSHRGESRLRAGTSGHPT